MSGVVQHLSFCPIRPRHEWRAPFRFANGARLDEIDRSIVGELTRQAVGLGFSGDEVAGLGACSHWIYAERLCDHAEVADEDAADFAAVSRAVIGLAMAHLGPGYDDFFGLNWPVFTVHIGGPGRISVRQCARQYPLYSHPGYVERPYLDRHLVIADAFLRRLDDLPARLGRSTRFFSRGLGLQIWEARYLMLSIALEGLLIGPRERFQNTNRGEWTAADRGATVLGLAGPRRDALREQFRRIYNARSGLTHEGSPRFADRPEAAEATDALSMDLIFELEDVLRRLLSTIVRRDTWYERFSLPDAEFTRAWRSDPGV